MSDFVICLKTDDYPASLEVGKVYRVMPDSTAQKIGQIRVIDKSGEDYLYPEDYFVPVELPEKARLVLTGNQ